MVVRLVVAIIAKNLHDSNVGIAEAKIYGIGNPFSQKRWFVPSPCGVFWIGMLLKDIGDIKYRDGIVSRGRGGWFSDIRDVSLMD